ncbi:MiaB/RimO family radical SAM methylthiotransferase [Treponema sp. OMZ 857]|uniref:MiaB/RimO family radical SAM methylthiotransferase n=1 Tax=Treponema sp. OMZ 857 TaxID=1643513 RepID=UPI0020A2ACFE|nr:MiaB/RimO family radical SAM methylthiotransferase [Treponema sp. OMZ 857]UTC44053.1 MiaB/RimO family radical SAM methylthiotransferase [Treponema sp. OMZ 857]
MTKRFFLDQHGCAKNQVDGELLIGILADKGWQKTSEPENADLIIVNSCGFIEPAKRESIEAVITARTAYPQAKILLAGCLAERYGDIFKTDFEEADAFFGNGDLSKLPILIDRLFPDVPAARQQLPREHDEPIHSTEHSRPFLKPAQEGVCCGQRPELLNFPRSAFIKITEGCDNCCSFCAIPLIRGSVRSRPLDSIVNEIRGFVQQGYKEFNLIGQDLAVYDATPPLDKLSSRLNNNLPALPTQTKQGLSGLAQLLHAISGIEGTFSVRLLYIHPDHFPPDILPIMTADTRFLPYFDIPFQSGSDPVIRAMNRCGSAETYLKLIETIRAAFRTAKSPYREAVIRTTFLTGFPGETQADFERTAAFLQAAQSLWSGAFAYSQEEGTKAADMKKQVPAKIAEQRKTALNELQLKITEQKLAAFCGLETDVLIEEIIPQEQNHEEENTQCCIALGRAWFQAPEVDGAVVVNFSKAQKDSEGQPITAGSLVRVRITALRGIDLEADAL